jgi:hypothetical protein
MKQVVSAIGVILGSAHVFAEDKPIVYDHITKDGASVDTMVNAALAPKYTITPVEDSPAYVDAKATGGSIPRVARTDSGELLKGYVLVAYVVTADGRAADPVVLKTTDSRLNVIATNAMQDWRFTPARLNNTAIATTAAQEFYFKSQAAPKGFETSNIVLYQDNDTLEHRLTAQPLADYIKKLQAVLTVYFADDTTPETFHTVVVLRPGKAVRVWFVSSRRPGDAQEFDVLRRNLESVAPADVQGGPVAFAISAKLAGGHSANKQDGAPFQPPIPKEWPEAAGNLKPTNPLQDAYLNAVWPDKNKPKILGKSAQRSKQRANFGA